MIRGKGIQLRTVRETDLDRLYALLSDIANRGDHIPLQIFSESKFRREFQETGFWSEDEGHALIVNSADEIVGKISFFKSIPYFDGLEIAYAVFDPQQRGQGIMTEALSLFTDYLFQSTTIHRVQLIITDGNIGSEKVAQKCGFTYEGTARQAMFARSRHWDMKLYSLLRHEVETCLPYRIFS